MQYQFQINNLGVRPIRDTWDEIIQDARDCGYHQFANTVVFPGDGKQWSRTGPSIMRIVKAGEGVIVGDDNFNN